MSATLNVAAWVAVYELCRLIVVHMFIRPTRLSWRRARGEGDRTQ